VQAYIAAMPGWKLDVGRRLDALIMRTVPDVRKSVKWNSPFYGIEGQGWFLNFHCFTKYVKVAFFRGLSLRPLLPGESKHKEVRYLDIHEPTGSTRSSWRAGFGRHRSCPDGSRSAGMMKREATRMHRYAYHAARRVRTLEHIERVTEST
jgi:hypothetical protein